MNLWFYADPHFGHWNVVKFCSRPFSTVLEMNETLVENFNKVVGHTDTVVFAGDFAMNHAYIRKYLYRLNGKWIWVRGNHDLPKWDKIVKDPDFISKVESWHDIYSFSPGWPITVCHYPMMSWPGSYRSSWQLFGHVHGRLARPTSFALDAGVDAWNYSPVHIDQIREVMRKKQSTGELI
jgi:calcineurin-like phosphoesterase family protein